MSLESEFEELRAHFRETAANRLAEMARCITTLLADPRDAGCFNTLSRHFHGLAGLGTTYGFPRISELADVGEAETIELLRHHAAPDVLRIHHWGALIEQMSAAIAGEAVPFGPAVIAQGASPRRQFTVLLVEDDPALRAWLTPLIESEGMDVRACGSRAAALEAIAGAVPDAIVTDLRLPDGDGSDVIAALRGTPGGEEALALAISALEGFDAKVDAIHAGADAHFEKPIDAQALLRRLTMARDRKSQPPERVLVVEDDPLQSAVVQAILAEAGYEVQICAEPGALEEAVGRVSPHLILMDVNFPGGINGYDLVRYLRQSDRFATLPVIFVTTEREVAKTRRAGGDDHLIKPVDPQALLMSVASRLERARVVRSLIDHDGLTGALTHTAFRARLEQAISRAASPVLALVDLDYFKRVNDTWGHRAGDRVLSTFGQFLRQNVRYTDAVGRWGGEEFGLLLEDSTLGEACTLLERLLRQFTAVEHIADGRRFTVAFSAGLAAPESEDVEAWIEAADRRLYEAKDAGRGRIVVG
ncbi:MAG TPA: response regulator [Thermoanaerobaculia bacterium]|jgi:diguanylate cyclase (GGDEF)-like protein